MVISKLPKPKGKDAQEKNKICSLQKKRTRPSKETALKHFLLTLCNSSFLLSYLKCFSFLLAQLPTGKKIKKSSVTSLPLVCSLKLINPMKLLGQHHFFYDITQGEGHFYNNLGFIHVVHTPQNIIYCNFPSALIAKWLVMVHKKFRCITWFIASLSDNLIFFYGKMKFTIYVL